MPTAYVNLSATGDLIPAVAGKQIILLGLCLTGDGVAKGTIGDDTPTNLSGINFTAGGGAAWFNQQSQLVGGVGKKLVLTLSASINVTGHVEYTLR